MSKIERMIQESKAFKLVSREFQDKDTIVKINGGNIGGKAVIMVAGPCSVENEQQVLEAAIAVKKSGARS